MRSMRRAVAGLVTVVAGAAVGCADAARGPAEPLLRTATPLLAALTETTNLRIPLDLVVFVPCAAGGAGELVALSGTLHVLTHVTESPTGNLHLKAHFQPQGVSGVGLTTGDKYQGTGVTQRQTNINGPLPFTDTFINNFRIIGQGPDNNFTVHQTIHFTVNANGEVTAEVVNTKVECQ